MRMTLNTLEDLPIDDKTWAALNPNHVLINMDGAAYVQKTAIVKSHSLSVYNDTCRVARILEHGWLIRINDDKYPLPIGIPEHITDEVLATKFFRVTLVRWDLDLPKTCQALQNFVQMMPPLKEALEDLTQGLTRVIASGYVTPEIKKPSKKKPPPRYTKKRP